MPRSRYQRPEVYEWKGKSGQKFWKAEWRVYIEGRPKPKHRAATWPCSEYTKGKAQEQCDKLVREETGGPARPDGSMLVKDFWKQIYFPTLKLRIAENSASAYESSWRSHIEGALGGMELQHVTKAPIDAILNRMAVVGAGQSSLGRVQHLIEGMFEEALENGYVERNPARKVTLPRGAESKPTRPLTEEEVQRLLTKTTGRAHIFWSVMVLTGARPNEVLALRKDDILSEGLRIDESALDGKPSTTKNRKTRIAPLSATLRAELEEWAKGVDGDILLPNEAGKMTRFRSPAMRTLILRTREAASIPDLKPRMCRTTFATLFNGDLADAQAILGHSALAMTMEHYRKPIAARQQRAVEDLDARLRGKVVRMKKKSA
jgi:integrase